MPKLTADAVKKFAKERGADLVGIASIDRFEGAPSHLHPAKTALSTAKSVVVVAKRIPRGCFRGNIEGTNFTTYTYYGYVFQQHRYYMYKLDYEVACFIEKHGWEAVPTQAVGAHFRIAAYLAGLGQIGWNQLLLTPQFGPRQRFGLIITDAELKPDPIFEGELCNPEDCGYRCIIECPNKAIPKTKKITLNVAGRTIEFSDLDLRRCMTDCIRLTMHSPFMRKDASRGRGMPLTAINEVVDCYRMLYRHVGIPPFVMRGSTGCMEACLEYLEERGKIPRYKLPFRRRS
ncbi:MAG: hypothetical protein QXR45_15400, partial [Candidatus Bathyarchaeia archaeon]